MSTSFYIRANYSVLFVLLSLSSKSVACSLFTKVVTTQLNCIVNTVYNLTNAIYKLHFKKHPSQPMKQ